MDQGRDYTYVADIAGGVRTVLDAPDLPHNIYNVTAGVWVTFREILDQLTQLSPSTKIVEVDTREGQSPDGGPARGPLSGHRMFQDFKWTPKYGLRAGLEDYLQWRRDAPFLN